MKNQKELISDLQASEMRRFQTVQEIYEAKTRNPRGLRRANLERAFHVVSAKKFVGWPFELPIATFLSLACDVATDYLTGPYISQQRPEFREEFEDPRKAVRWFDVVQLGLYFGSAAQNEKTLTSISNWVTFGMQEDSGIEEVSQDVNILYEHICCLIRNEKLPDDLSARLKLKKPGERYLWAMLDAISEAQLPEFTAALEGFKKSWRGNTKHAALFEIVSVEASTLCSLWERMVGVELGTVVDCRSIQCSSTI